MSMIEAGTKVVMEITGLPDRLHSFFVGYINKRCVIVMMPMVPEVNRNLLLEHVYKGNRVTVRFIRSGAVFGFQSAITYFSFTPYPLLFLEYPSSIESHNLRKDRRVSCLFPVIATLNEKEYHGVLSNISQSGGRAFFPDNGFRGIKLGIDDQLQLTCPILFESRDAAILATIKRVNTDKEKVELGLKFSKVPEDIDRRINTFIEQTILFAEG